MAAVNFPDPAATNPDTGLTNAQGWTNPDNGVTYVYTNNVWSAIKVPDSALNDKYVEVAGDNMTGPLWFDTNKIRLNTDGTATFAGIVTPNGLTTIKSGVGNTYVGGASSTWGLQVTNSSDARVFGAAYDGSAEFAGAGVFGNNPSVQNSNPGVRINTFSDGTTGWLNTYQGGLRLFQNDSSTPTPTAEIKASDGSADFSGTGAFEGNSIATLRVGSPTRDLEHGIRLQKQTNNIPYYGDVYLTNEGIKFGTGTSTDNIRNSGDLITFANGSAEFAGSLESKAGLTNGSRGVFSTASGAVNLVLFGPAGARNVEFKSIDGSAEFAGSIKSQAGRSDLARLYLGGDGTASPTIIVRDTSDNANVWSGRSTDNTETSSITADGSAEFAGAISCGTPSLNGTYGYMEPGIVSARRAASGAVWQGYKGGITTPTSQIMENGSAEFAGPITVANYNTSLDDVAGALIADGAIRVQRASNRGTTNVYEGYLGQNRTYEVRANGSVWIAGGDITLDADGSAEFAGGVTSELYFIVDRNTSDNGFTLFYGSNDTNADGKAKFIVKGSGTYIGEDVQISDNNGANISLLADGSADFASNVTSDGYYLGTAAFFTSPTPGAGWNSFGIRENNGDQTLNIYSDGTVHIGDSLTGAISADNEKISLNPSGSATFAGRLQVDQTSTVYLGDAVIVSELYGLAFSSAANKVEFGVKYDGSATFATGRIQLNNGGILVRNPNSSGDVKVQEWKAVSQVDSNVEVSVAAVYADGDAKFAGTVEQNATITRSVVIETEPDNDDNYTTTTDAEGNETRVYNGPTLDVKDRLTKTQDALTALKAAAQDNATDLAGLKAAIVAALANI